MVNKVPSSRHLQKRLYTVFQDPKRSGKSRHAAPLLAIHKIALNINRLSLGGRPVFATENKSSI